MTEQDANAEPIENVTDQSVEVEDAEPESSPEQDEQPVKKTDGVQKRFNELTAKRYEAERKAEALERKLADIEAAKPVEVANMPELPQAPSDMYDSEEVAKYHKDMAAYSQQVAQATAKQALMDSQKAGQETQRQSEMQQVISTYASNAVRDGVDLDKLRAAEQVLAQEGISPELGAHIMKEPNGGVIATYLLDNPSVRHELLSLGLASAGVKLENEIKAQALSKTPKVSNAPEPIPHIEGGGGALDRDDFERSNPGTEFI